MRCRSESKSVVGAHGIRPTEVQKMVLMKMKMSSQGPHDFIHNLDPSEIGDRQGKLLQGRGQGKSSFFFMIQTFFTMSTTDIHAAINKQRAGYRLNGGYLVRTHGGKSIRITGETPRITQFGKTWTRPGLGLGPLAARSCLVSHEWTWTRVFNISSLYPKKHGLL